MISKYAGKTPDQTVKVLKFFTLPIDSLKPKRKHIRKGKRWKIKDGE